MVAAGDRVERGTTASPGLSGGGHPLPGATEAREPTTVTNSRRPFALTCKTAKPFSLLWKVTRWIRPERLSVGHDGSSGVGLRRS